MDKDVSNNYASMMAILKNLRLRSQWLKYTGALMLWLASLSIAIIIWFVFGGVLKLPGELRIPVIIILMGGIIWAGYIFIFKTAIKRLSIESMAIMVEKCYPESQDRIISSLQLWPELIENKYGYSKVLIARVIQEAHEILNGIDKSRILLYDIKRLKRATIAIVCALIPLILLILLFPSTFADSIDALKNPFESNALSNPIKIIDITPGNIDISPGESVDISFFVTGPGPSKALLYYKPEKGDGGIISLSGKNESSRDIMKLSFSTRLENLKESLEYYVSIADVKSEKYKINVIYKPIVDSIQLELQYPKYTGLPSQSLEPNMGDITALLGTKVLVSAMSNKELASAFLVFDNKDSSRMDVKNSKKISGSFIIQRNGTYYISITDKDGYPNLDPVKYSINVLTDQIPRVNILKPGASVEIGEKMLLSLQIEAQDDYGISKMNLHYQIQGDDKKYIIPLGTYKNPPVNALLDYTWNFEPLKLFPGDIISYYVEAYDTDNVSGPNTGRSATFTARFPSLYDMYKGIEEAQQVQNQEMKDLRNKQEDVKEIVDDLISKIKKEKELDWNAKKDLEQAAELQKQIQEQMKELAQEINKTVEKMKENPLIGSEALEKIEELKKLFNELATDEMKQIMQKLSESLDKINPSQQQRDLMTASFKQEEFIEKLDRMIDLFKRMQLKQKLEAAANQAAELVKQQTDTLQQTEDLAKNGIKDQKDQTKSDVLGDREARIKDQAEKLQKDLDELSKEMRDKFPNIADMVSKISQQAQKSQMNRDLQNASSELKNKNPSGSLPNQRNALSKLSQLQSNLQEAQEAMEGQDASEIISVLREAIRNSLYLSHRHEEITQATMNIKSDPDRMLPKEKKIIDSLAAEEIDLSDGAKKIADQLRDLSRKSSSVSPELVWNMDRVADGMSRSASAMADKFPSLVGPIQRNTLSVLNSAIQEMLDSIDQINSQAMSMPSMDDYMEQLRQLAEQQSQLNQSTQNADSLQRRQGMTPSLEQMLEKMAVEQSLIKEATERLSTKLDQMAQTMGNLEEVAKEMQDVEQDLREGFITRETIERQRRILTRLLDYEKSLKKQDFDRNRESRVGRDYISERPETSLPEDATKIKQNIDNMFSPKNQEQWPKQYQELIRMYYKALSNKVKDQSGVKR